MSDQSKGTSLARAVELQVLTTEWIIGERLEQSEAEDSGAARGGLRLFCHGAR